MIMKRITLSLMAMIGLWWSSAIGAQSVVAPKRPNIILILADDLGYGDIAAFDTTEIETPNLSRMAAEGVKFTQFYSGSTVCAPSRSVLMTGYHVGHARVRGNAGKDIQTLRKGDWTVARVLKTAGYRTALVGKWGLGDVGNEGQPNDQGFDYFYGFLNQVHAHNHYPDFVWRNKSKVKLENTVQLAPEAYMDFHGGVALPKDRRVYIEDEFRREALQFIDDASKSERPFFLYYSLISPHANNEADKVDWAHGLEIPTYDRYAQKPWPDESKGYAAMVSHIDHSVGLIMDRLRQLGVADETLIIFTSDNGTHSEGGYDPQFLDSNGPFRGIKRDMFEGGIRQPTIAWGPGLVPYGQVTEHVGYFADMWPTFAELVGLDVADLPGGARDGVSFVPSLTGRGTQQSHDFLYWEFYEHGSAQALRLGKWKAVRVPMLTGPVQLYDLSTDTGETRNVASAHPDLVGRIINLMAQEHVDDPNWQPQLRGASKP